MSKILDEGIITLTTYKTAKDLILSILKSLPPPTIYDNCDNKLNIVDDLDDKDIEKLNIILGLIGYHDYRCLYHV